MKKFLTSKLAKIIIEEEKDLGSKKVLDFQTGKDYNRGRKGLREQKKFLTSKLAKIIIEEEKNLKSKKVLDFQTEKRV